MSLQKAKYPQNAHGSLSLRIESWARGKFRLNNEQIKQTIFYADQLTYCGTFVEALLQILRTTEPSDACLNAFFDTSRAYLGKRFGDIPEDVALTLFTLVEDALNNSVMEEENK